MLRQGYLLQKRLPSAVRHRCHGPGARWLAVLFLSALPVMHPLALRGLEAEGPEAADILFVSFEEDEGWDASGLRNWRGGSIHPDLAMVNASSRFNRALTAAASEFEGAPAAPHGEAYAGINLDHAANGAHSTFRFADGRELTEPFVLSAKLAWDGADAMPNSAYYMALADSGGENDPLRHGIGFGFQVDRNQQVNLWASSGDRSLTSISNNTNGFRVLAEPGKFYRFELTVRPEDGNYDVSVFDDQENLVASEEGLVFFMRGFNRFGFNAPGIGGFYIDEIRIGTAGD